MQNKKSQVALRIQLALEDEVGGGARQSGSAPNAGRVAHTQTHPLG